MSYNAENRLVSVSGAATASFTYDGDGRQVKAVVGSVTTYYIGAHYQVDNGIGTKYYFAGAQRVAMRSGSTLYYLLGDHLGSTSITTNTSGALVSELRYKPWGETRNPTGTTPTSYQFTGQRNEVSIGLYFYNARWYDSSTGRFAQADTVTPSGAQGLDRYAYANNSPINYVDPSGHKVCDGAGINGVCDQSGIPSTLGQVNIALRSYGVRLKTKGSAQWTFDDAYAAYLGVTAVGDALSRVSGQEATTIFKKAFGPMTFTLRNDSEMTYFGRGWDGNVEFKAGEVTAKLTAHELAHSFEAHMYANNGNVYADNDPIVMLELQGIYDANNNLVTGKGLSNRYNGKYAFDNGYYCDSYIGECQWHSRDVGNWNNESEDWADIFMNWTYKSFYPNPAGDALYNWVETNMPSWLK